jgi:hypothetical protein
MPDTATTGPALPLLRRPLDIAIRTPQLTIVLLANAAWVLFPVLVLIRFSRGRPFVERVP